MAKEWILNSATNRFQLNFSRNVGRVSEEIRKCSPRILEDWETYYYSKIHPKEHLVSLGRKLYVKITEVLSAEIDDITENDCIDFLITLVINRTFDGYMTEKNTIYGQLQKTLGVKIEPASDEWDRLFNVDFYIQVNNKYIGLQIKPVAGTAQIPEIYKERKLQLKTHEQFAQKYGGKVFYIISMKSGDKKLIHNVDVIDDIKAEIKRLQS